MAEAFTHPTAGRRRRDKGPPSMPTLPRLDRVSDTECEPSDDSTGEKEAKRQRSEPITPVSTSGRLPYDYDAVMGITRVGTKEVEGFGRIWTPQNTMMQQKNQFGKMNQTTLLNRKGYRISKGVMVVHH